MTPDQAWHELVEKDDRTSPEEHPEMCLVTFEELSDFMTSTVAICEDELAGLIMTWFTEEWRSDSGNRWQEDVLLTGCRKVGNGVGYQKPEQAADKLRRDLAKAIMARLRPYQQRDIQQSAPEKTS